MIKMSQRAIGWPAAERHTAQPAFSINRRQIDNARCRRYRFEMCLRITNGLAIRQPGHRPMLSVVALLCIIFAPRVHAQHAAASRGPVQSVSGFVYDSIARRPLAGAVVQLVLADSLSAAARTIESDSLGRYMFGGVHPGRYLLGFLHPMIDSLGVEPKLRDLTVETGQAMRVDLTIPSAQTLRVGLCGAAAVADSQGLVIGIIRHATDRLPVDSARVMAKWVKYSLGAGGLSRTMPERIVVTHETGWYAICGAPSAGTMALGATRGSDSTQTIELEVPRDGFVRRDLYFGTARPAPPDSTTRALDDSTSLRRGPDLIGDGRLSGVVVSAGGRPLNGARISIVNGPQTRANSRGEWMIANAPTGTRMLDVRALAHYPVTMVVDVVEGAPPLTIEMSTLQAVLDTVRVVAKRGGNRNLLEFMQRKQRSGSGRFLTGEDIASRRPIYTSDLFRSIPGVSVDRDRNGDEVITMRGNSFSSPRCRASIFVNGMSMRGLSAGDINGFVRPNELIGVEVYSAAAAPAQFSEQNGCGSVVFWTR